MSKLKLRIQLDEEFEVDLKPFLNGFIGLSEKQIKKELIDHYFREIGKGEIRLSVNIDSSIKMEVYKNIYSHMVEFYEIELGRKLTKKEIENLTIWVYSGQNYVLKL